jgi:DNA-binding NarL/FixJ family response regulator
MTPWHVRPGLVGLRLARATRSPDEVEALLVERHGLSAHQARVAALIARGWSNTAVAAALGVRPGTVRALSTTVYAKLGVHTRLDLAGVLAEVGATAAGDVSGGVGGRRTRPFQPAAHPVAL